METKVCKRCQRRLPRSEFYPMARMRDGLFSSCKACHRQYNAANRAAKRAYYAAYDRLRYQTPERKELLADMQRMRRIRRRRLSNA